jgi:hypothetical protein
MNIIRVVCANPQCGTILRIQPRQAGKRIRCPKCQIALVAPFIPGLADEGQAEGDAEDADAGPSCFMTVLFLVGLFTGLVLVVAAAVGFEVWFYHDSQPVNQGPAATLLGNGPWKTVAREGKQQTMPPDQRAWAKAGTVWTFYPNGKAESGKVLADINRYDREDGFDTWTWSTDGDDLKLKLRYDYFQGTSHHFAVGQDKDKMILTSTREEGPVLTLAKTEPLKSFPDLRVVFYAGVVAPMLVAWLLAWLISREVFYSGWLRFALGWPLTILLGVALGAGAGYLLDVLNDFNYNPAPYWMVLAFAQGVLGLGTGLALGVLSCLRPT